MKLYWDPFLLLILTWDELFWVLGEMSSKSFSSFLALELPFLFSVNNRGVTGPCWDFLAVFTTTPHLSLSLQLSLPCSFWILSTAASTLCGPLSWKGAWWSGWEWTLFIHPQFEFAKPLLFLPLFSDWPLSFPESLSAIGSPALIALGCLATSLHVVPNRLWFHSSLVAVVGSSLYFEGHGAIFST